MVAAKSYSVARVLDQALRERPDAEALVGRHARYSYRELDEAAACSAAALARLGVGPGDRVAASMSNHPDIVVAFLGTMRLGAIWLGINRALAPPEKAFIIDDSEPSVMLADHDMADEVRDLTSVPVVTVDPEDPTSEWATLLRASGDGAPVVDIDPHAPAAIAYTGGTTGFPKGVVHSQHNLMLIGAVQAAMGDYSTETRFGVILPLTILNVMALTPLKAFQIGAGCITMDRVDPVGAAEWVRTERITSFGAVPTIVHGLLTHPDVRQEDLVTLTRPEVGGADCPEEFRALYRERFGTEVALGYGLTEAPTAVTLERPGAPHLPGCAGVALPHVRITVRDERGHELAAGESGEVCVEAATEGPWAGVYTPMLGYWKQPEATELTLRDGILHTGDIGMLDDDGNLFIQGRKGDLIIRGGANVYPAEVERALHEDHRVAACAVVGRPDERLGERVVAFIEVAGDEPLDAEVLRAHCAERMARYKVPEEFVFVDSFTWTPMGKIRKVDLP
jgi:acyl-CoA synthetase (AMP-forming)/AMP-acid ligase II